MLVSHRYKFIYLKARKVAGTTIESVLERYCVSPNDEKSYEINHDANYKNTKHGIISSRMRGKSGGGWYNHKTSFEIKRDLKENEWENYVKICNIRNPYDMVVSWFHYQTNTKGINKEKFNNFVKNNSKLSLIINNKRIWSDNNKYDFEYIRFENMEEDLNRIMKKLGLPKYEIDIPHFKKSIRGDWKEYYDEETKEIVYNLFKDEIELFNYKF